MKRVLASPLLLAFLILLGLLVLVLLGIALKRPPQGGLQETLLGKSVDTEARKFDPDLGSLASLVPHAGGVAPVPAVVNPVEHGGEYRDITWLKAQNPDAYTLQVLGARSEEAVKRFIAGQDDPSQFSYFETREAGRPWFVVVHGNYASRELALGVADTLDIGLDSKPFPKRFGAYVDALALSAQPPAEAAPEPVEPEVPPAETPPEVP